jgi:hypothetical protein
VPTLNGLGVRFSDDLGLGMGSCARAHARLPTTGQEIPQCLATAGAVLSGARAGSVAAPGAALRSGRLSLGSSRSAPAGVSGPCRSVHIGDRWVARRSVWWARAPLRVGAPTRGARPQRRVGCARPHPAPARHSPPARAGRLWRHGQLVRMRRAGGDHRPRGHSPGPAGGSRTGIRSSSGRARRVFHSAATGANAG